MGEGSLDDAVKSAYLDGKIDALRGMTVKQFLHQQEIKVNDVPRIGQGYESNAIPMAQRRVALAGYRLADALTELLANP